MNFTRLVYLNTPYGNIELQGYKINPQQEEFSGIRMLLNDGLQWDSKDEHRYHQTLFVAPYLFVNNKKKKINVLVLGGGDGLGVRELLKLKGIENITLVDINPIMTTLCKEYEPLVEINQNSLNNSKVRIINKDAFEFVQKEKENKKQYDIIIADYPDPLNIPSPLDKLFSKEHYQDIKDILNENGVFSLQATSVYSMPNVFRKIQLTIQEVFETQLPLRINIPSFGDIGIILAQKKELKIWNMYRKIPQHIFYDENTFNYFTVFFKDEYPFLKDEIIIDSEIWKLMEYDLTS